MNYEIGPDGHLLTQGIDLTTERRRQLVPILPLVHDLHRSIVMEEHPRTIKEKLERLGTILLPHAGSRRSPLELNYFIQTGTEVTLTKHSRSSVDIGMMDADVTPLLFHVVRTDIHNGMGTSLSIVMHRDDQFALGINIEQALGAAWIGVTQEKDGPLFMALRKPVLRGWIVDSPQK